MAATTPQRISTNPFRALLYELRAERAADGPYPRGELRPSLARTRRFERDPLPVLLEAHRSYGPVFTLRLLHAPFVFMLGPEANHYVTVAGASNFIWREGSFGDMIPLLGDGLLTTDGAYHRRQRRTMLPAFHRERIEAAAEVMLSEARDAIDRWELGEQLDLYGWTRQLALRIAMRALFGLDPDRGAAAEFDAAAEFERALSFYGKDYAVRLLRGPRTPWARMQRSRERLDRLIYSEIGRRRGTGSAHHGEDVLSLLLAAHDEDGQPLTERELRDQVMTLLFAGHDTTTSTVSFLFYELARKPQALARVLDEQDRVLPGGRAPTGSELWESLPELERCIAETLRLYPPAWIGPRRSLESFELAGVHVPGGALVAYCAWASHRLPEVFPEPEAFVPDRFRPEARAEFPRGAYVPFGGGSRTCLGMRFGELEIKVIATIVLQRFRLELVPGRTMQFRRSPTLSPREGLPVTIRERGLPEVVGPDRIVSPHRSATA